MKARHDQHFLIDKNAIGRIADTEDVKGKVVLEIGPGNGALTRALLDRGATGPRGGTGRDALRRAGRTFRLRDRRRAADRYAWGCYEVPAPSF